MLTYMKEIEVPVKMGVLGRAQIPLEIRERLGIEQGDFLLIKIKKIIKGEMEKSSRKEEAPK